MNKTWKRWGALLLALVMALSLFPASALAARIDDTERPAVPAEEAEEFSAAPAVIEDDEPVDLSAAGDITATDDSRDIDRTTYTMTADSYISSDGAGQPDAAKDGNEGTWWHSNSTKPAGGHWIAVELDQATWVSALRYKPRADYTSANPNASAGTNGNGYVTSYEVYTSMNGTDWSKATSGDWAAFDANKIPTGAWQVANFTPVKAKHVKLVGVKAGGNNANSQDSNTNMHAAEIRVVAAPPVENVTVSGTVTDGTSGLEGAAVTLVRAAVPYTTVTGVSATTTAGGTYTLTASTLPAGTYKVRAAKTGFGAALGGDVEITADAPTASNVTVALAALGEPTYNMTSGSTPTYTPGESTAARVENGGLFMNFNGTDRDANQVKLTGVSASGVEVEFDATRGGTGTGGFGVALRFEDSDNYFYVGQDSTASGWISESVNAGTHQTSEAVRGPSFAAGETRHFKVSIFQSGDETKVSLSVDGVQVLENVKAGGANGQGPTAAGPIAFVSGVNNTTVTVKDLYITNSDGSYTITMPAELQGYVVTGEGLSALGQAEDAATGTFTARAGDVVNIYSADPAVKEMSAPLTVYKVEPANAVHSTEYILHIPHTGHTDQAKTLGRYVQFRMPAYDVTLTPKLRTPLKSVTLTTDETTGMMTATVTPAGADADFQWFRSGEGDGVWLPIPNATRATYTPQAADAGRSLKVEAIGKGDHTGAVEASTATVVTNAVKSVSILRSSTANEVVNVGASINLTATLTPAQGVDLAVAWKAEPADVVSVEALPNASKDPDMDAAYSTVTVTGLKAGEATVTITTANGLTDTRKVTVGRAVANVLFAENDEFTLYTNPVTAQQSSTKTLTPTVNPSDAINKALTWWSTDEKVATVDQSGKVTAVAPGTAQIHVRSQQNPKAEAYRPVRVIKLPEALTLDVTQVELILRPGSAPGTQVVVPTLTPDGVSDKTLQWTTGNGAVASVTKPWADETEGQNQSALITAQGVGKTTITATSYANSSLVKTVAVTVKQEIVGKAAVSGALKFGSELTADVNDIIEAAKNDLTYAWYRGEAAEGTALATTKTYTPVKEDIGQKLTVKITAGGELYFGETTFTTEAIEKADGPIITGAGASGIHGERAGAAGNDGKIVGFPADDGNVYEWKPKSAAEDAYQTVQDGEVTGLSVGEYNVRIQKTDTHKAGTPITVTVVPHDVTAHLINIGEMTPAGAGTVTRLRGQAEMGEERVLTVRPSDGYQLEADGLRVVGESGGEIELTKGEPVEEDGKSFDTYTFRMPNEAVTVTARFEKKSYTITHELTNITCSLGDAASHAAVHGKPFSITLTPADGYEMPRSLTVIGTDSGTKFTDYTYTADPANAEGRVLTFTHGVTQAVTVKGSGELKDFPVSYERTRVSFTFAPARAGWHQELVAAVTADAGYELPETITVTMGGATLAPTRYTYNRETGAVRIPAGVVEGNLTISVEARVKTVALEKVSITGVAKVGELLTANITPAEADGHVTYQWCWAELDSSGNVTATQEIGEATGRNRSITTASLNKYIVMKVTAVEGGGFSGTVLSQPTGLVVAADAAGVMPANVQIVRPSVTLEVGGTDTLVAYVTPSNATDKTVLWSSSNPAAVSVENGVITGVGPGVATITATSKADPRLTADCRVTVTAPRAVQATAEDELVEFDGRAHSILVLVTDPVDGSAKITYSSDGVNFHATNPTFSAVGEHMVWYKVTANGRAGVQGQAKVTIEKATPEIFITADRSSLSAAGRVTLTVTLPDYADRAGSYVEASDPMLSPVRSGDGSYTVELPGDYKTYTFTVTLPGSDNYDTVTASCTVRVGATSTGGSSSSGNSTTTETKDDGTKVTTETKPDGTVTETTETPDGTVAVVETKPDGSKTQTVEQADGTKSELVTTKDGDVTITVTDPEGEELVKTEIPAAIPEPETKFEDVDTTPWAEEAINKVAGLELVNGTGGNKYSPVAPMTRGSLATVLHRLSQGKTDYEVTFKDVAQGKYYTEGVAWAAKAKVVTGYSADIFAPDDVITREQLAVMLARYAKLVGLNTKADAKALESFTDGEKTGAWAVDGMAWCVENGILKGKGRNNLDPTADVTRAEVAVMLDRFIALLK